MSKTLPDILDIKVAIAAVIYKAQVKKHFEGNSVTFVPIVIILAE